MNYKTLIGALKYLYWGSITFYYKIATEFKTHGPEISIWGLECSKYHSKAEMVACNSLSRPEFCLGRGYRKNTWSLKCGEGGGADNSLDHGEGYPAERWRPTWLALRMDFS